MKTQGQSQSVTENKIRGFASIFDTNLRISKAIFAKSRFPCRYFHFDLHGGSGFNDEVGVVGSPVLFRDIACEVGVPFRLHASEIDEKRSKSLGSRLSFCEHSFVHCGDNRELAAMIPDIISACRENPAYAIGTILIDPNGAADIPWRELSGMASKCPKLDVVINYNATIMKRMRQQGMLDHLVHLCEIPSMLQKKHWLIRKPIKSDRWQFTTIVGRNYEVGDHKRLQIYKWDSDEGKECLRLASLTKEERKSSQKTLEITDGELQEL